MLQSAVPELGDCVDVRCPDEDQFYPRLFGQMEFEWKYSMIFDGKYRSRLDRDDNVFRDLLHLYLPKLIPYQELIKCP